MTPNAKKAIALAMKDSRSIDQTIDDYTFEYWPSILDCSDKILPKDAEGPIIELSHKDWDYNMSQYVYWEKGQAFLTKKSNLDESPPEKTQSIKKWLQSDVGTFWFIFNICCLALTFAIGTSVLLHYISGL